MDSKFFSSALSIKARLILGFACIIMVLFFAVSITVDKINNTKIVSQNIIQNQLPIYDELIVLHREILIVQTNVRGWVLTHNPLLKKEFEQSWNNIDASILRIDALIKKSDEEDLRTWQGIKRLFPQLRIAQFKTLNAQDTQESTKILNTQNTPTADKILDLLNGPANAIGQRTGGLFARQDIKFHNGASSIIDDMNELEVTEYLLLSLGILLSIVIASVTIRSILVQINRFRKYTTQIAAGDLTTRLTINNHDEMGQLGNDLNAMTDSLANITKEITQANLCMVTTLEEVRSAVETQSSGAIEQAASVNEITASLEEIEKSSAQTMDKAHMLGKAATQTSEKGKQGLEAIENSIKGMKIVGEKVQSIAETILELSNKTQQIGEITAVVTNLAQQSKMLALNASIEAAKAGEAGKGFAVVAEEVKNLAEQSEQSTKQVQQILEDIRNATERSVMVTEEGIKGVEHGTLLVEETAEIVRSLSDVIHETTLASQQIEIAINQETIGIEQIAAGMSEINQVTSSFVESVTQTTEAIESLATLAKNLKKHVDFYQA